MEWAISLFPLNCCIARFYVVSIAFDLRLSLFIHRKNRVVTVWSGVTTRNVVTLGEYFHPTEE